MAELIKIVHKVLGRDGKSINKTNTKRDSMSIEEVIRRYEELCAK